jgi:hypothetical protein
LTFTFAHGTISLRGESMGVEKNYLEKLIDQLPLNDNVEFTRQGKEAISAIKDDIESLQRQSESIKKLMLRFGLQDIIKQPKTKRNKTGLSMEMNKQVGDIAVEFARTHSDREIAPSEINEKLKSSGINLKDYVGRPTSVIASIMRKIEGIEKIGLNKYRYKEVLK